MKRSLTAFIGIVLMLAMTLALVGCNKKTDETVTVTTAAPTVVTQQAEEATEAQQNQSATQKATQKATEKATKKATKKATQKSTKKATQKTTEKATQKTTEATGSPVQRFQGRYGSDRCTVDVKGVANNTVEIHIYWASSAWDSRMVTRSRGMSLRSMYRAARKWLAFSKYFRRSGVSWGELSRRSVST